MLESRLSRPPTLNMARLALGLRHSCCLSPLRYQLLRQVPASATSIRAPVRAYSSVFLSIRTYIYTFLRIHFTYLIFSPGHNQTASQGAYSYTYPPPPPPPTYKKRSLFRRILGFSVIALGSFLVGAMTSPELVDLGSEIASMRQLSKTEVLYIPPDEISKEINDYIDTHPLAVSLRGDARYTESRPHLEQPSMTRAHSLTGGTLTGPGRIVVPPFTWSTTDGSSFVSIFYLGSDVCGHPGIVHGGLLATLLDEGLARTCFPVLPNKIGVTANLNIDYRAPAPAGEFFVLRAKVTKVDGRKAWVEGWIEGLPKDGTDPVKAEDGCSKFDHFTTISHPCAVANMFNQLLTKGQKDTSAKTSPSTAR
ncbi:thioesterase family protein [Trichophyton benhamiae CBS 112371]|uniref:Thioesterase family protein n=1 Tax=Arthroderma benhamiae (strain ATCC MYA-4681 / CBS 112371) TaxID=663331 RepID=D4B305_ARTBC|nr:thioesterase family protein [Trichophyton benhamiae CBS 112371]EFE30301.1 thioesterase family protein [Trichophyton benhamiae CBS 112371]